MNPRRQRAADKLRDKLGRRFEPKARYAHAVLDEPTRNSAGQIQQWRATLDGGTTVEIPAGGLAGEGVGAMVLLEVRGPATGASYRIWQVVRPAAGTGTTDPHGMLSTPDVAFVETDARTGPGGSVAVDAYVTLWMIAEQYRQGQIVGYQIEVLDATTGQMVADRTYGATGLVAGQLTAALSQYEVDELFIEATPIEPPPNLYAFSPWHGIIQIGDELIRYGAFLSGWLACFVLTRGYSSTTAADHDDEALVRLRGRTIAVPALAPNTEYEVRCKAYAADGRESTWSDWTSFTTDYDLTPPTWSTGPTVTVEAGSGAFIVSWPAADTNAGDLAYYEVGVSTDDATWTTYRAGNGTRWAFPAEPGFVRFFRVRAVDTTGNASGWSSSTRATLPVPNEPSGTNLLNNPSFATNTSDWSISSMSGTATLTRDASVYYDAAGAGKIQESRDASLQRTLEVTSGTNEAIAAGSMVYLRGFLRSSGMASGDEGALILQFRNSGGTIIATKSLPFTGTELNSTTRWFPRFALLAPPQQAASVRVLVSLTLGTGAGTVSLWIDDLTVHSAVTTDNPLVSYDDASSSPGAAARVLRSTSAGGLTLKTLTLTDYIQLTPLAAAPGSPANGMIAYADGTSWNPGKGAGFYGYQAGVWEKFV